MQAAQRAPRLGSAAPPLCFPPHPSAQQGCESSRREVRHPWGAPCWWLCPGHPQHCLTLSPALAVVSPGWTRETPMLGGRALWGCPGQGTHKWRVVTLRAACLLWGFLPSLLRAFSPAGRGEGPREADLPARQRWARSALGAFDALGPPAALQMAPGVLVWGRDLPEDPRGGVGAFPPAFSLALTVSPEAALRGRCGLPAHRPRRGRVWAQQLRLYLLRPRRRPDTLGRA